MSSTKEWLPQHALSFRNQVLWSGLLGILVLSLALRAFFYTGFFGSDEVTYLDAAARVLHGDWSPSTYIGAVRYGFQLPIAGFMYLFGQNEFAANLWTILCSLGEIAIVVVIGNSLFGFRSAMLAGLILGVLPLHVHYAGRIMADAPLAFFMTSSFLLFWLGQMKDKASVFLMAGLAAGYVFWIKEVVVIYLALFITFPLIFRCWNWKWLWMVLGFALMLGGNFLLLWTISGDPLYVLNIALSAASDYSSSNGRFSQGNLADSPLYYLEYLFLRVYHTWILGYLMLAGLYGAWRARTSGPSRIAEIDFVVWWGLGLLLLFSLVPVSLHPLKLISKQANYMLMFMAPLALIAGHFMGKLHGRAFIFLLLATLVPAFVLSALEKNTVAVFTANSKAAVLLSKNNPNAQIYGPTGAEQAATFYTLMNPDSAPVHIKPIDLLLKNSKCNGGPGSTYAIVDPEAFNWGGSSLRALEDVPDCWKVGQELVPISEISMISGLQFLQKSSALILPTSIHDKVSAKIKALTEPKAAYVYRVPGG